LIEDESLYENVNEAAAKLNILLDKINKGEGPVGSLVSSKELKEDLQATLKELNSLIKDIKEHPRKYFKFSVF
jgi:phospholipid/cholesterol/gamma-HCH transport system substrate-binding protein